MARKAGSKRAAEPVESQVRDVAEFLWHQHAGHFDGALSKRLVGPDTPGAQFLNFVMSSYAPKAYVQSHAHEAKEQVYFFLEGEGLLELGSERHLVRKNSFAFIPRTLPHALYNTGTVNLVFLVATTATTPPA